MTESDEVVNYQPEQKNTSAAQQCFFADSPDVPYRQGGKPPGSHRISHHRNVECAGCPLLDRILSKDHVVASEVPRNSGISLLIL